MNIERAEILTPRAVDREIDLYCAGQRRRPPALQVGALRQAPDRLSAMEEEAARSALRLACERGESGERSRIGSSGYRTERVRRLCNYVCINSPFHDLTQCEKPDRVFPWRANLAEGRFRSRLCTLPNHLGLYCSFRFPRGIARPEAVPPLYCGGLAARNLTASKLATQPTREVSKTT
jgi:hypothetical protein